MPGKLINAEGQRGVSSPRSKLVIHRLALVGSSERETMNQEAILRLLVFLRGSHQFLDFLVQHFISRAAEPFLFDDAFMVNQVERRPALHLPLVGDRFAVLALI